MTIKVDDNAYQLLVNAKIKDETISDTIIRLFA